MMMIICCSYNLGNPGGISMLHSVNPMFPEYHIHALYMWSYTICLSIDSFEDRYQCNRTRTTRNTVDQLLNTSCSVLFFILSRYTQT